MLLIKIQQGFERCVKICLAQFLTHRIPIKEKNGNEAFKLNVDVKQWLEA